MHYFFDEKPDVVSVLWIGASATVLALLMFLCIIVMHWIVTRREQEHAQKLSRWRELLDQVSRGDIDHLPALTEHDAVEFAEAWNDLHDAMPEGQEALRRAGQQAGLSAVAHQLLGGRHHQQVMAISALGHMGDASDFEHISPFLSDPSPIISLCAARALSQIDVDKAIELFLPALMKRSDWPDESIAGILTANNRGNIDKALSSAILHANDNTVARLLRFLVDTDVQRAATVIRHLLDVPSDDHVISTCLQLVSDRSDIDLVRCFLVHPRWHVRMHAASAVGRLGDGSDERRLIALLSDSQWWVRYRAARALQALPGMKDHEIYRLSNAQQDVFAREILQHVLAEPLRGGAV